jgi:hypothetical protein
LPSALILFLNVELITLISTNHNFRPARPLAAEIGQNYLGFAA